MSKFINPTPEEIKEARANAGITQKNAAEILHTSIRAYQQWEAGDRAMHPAFWELFLVKLERINCLKDQWYGC
jgi:DNA-binding transcriptional regulator YiaG